MAQVSVDSAPWKLDHQILSSAMSKGRFYLGFTGGSVEIADLTSKIGRFTIFDDEANVTALAATENHLAVGSYQRIALFDIRAAKTVSVWTSAKADCVHSLTFTDPNNIVFGSNDHGGINSISLTSGKVRTLVHRCEPWAWMTQIQSRGWDLAATYRGPEKYYLTCLDLRKPDKRELYCGCGKNPKVVHRTPIQRLLLTDRAVITADQFSIVLRDRATKTVFKNLPIGERYNITGLVSQGDHLITASNSRREDDQKDPGLSTIEKWDWRTGLTSFGKLNYHVKDLFVSEGQLFTVSQQGAVNRLQEKA